MTERVTRQVLAVVVRGGAERAQLCRVWADTQFVTVALDGKVTLVRPTGRKDYPGWQGFEVWREGK